MNFNPHANVTELHTVFCDGTSQFKDQPIPTNIAILHDALLAQDQNGVFQTKEYYAGIGTQNILQSSHDNNSLCAAFNKLVHPINSLAKTFNAITGHSIEELQKHIYKDIALSHHDSREYAFMGYSRGGYTVRSLCGLMYKCGIVDVTAFIQDGNINEEALDQAIEDIFDFWKKDVRPSSKRAADFRDKYNAQQPNVRTLVDLDTVGALGMPRNLGPLSKLFKDRHEYHDTRVNRRITYALKLIAAEEKRHNFSFTPLYLHDVTVSDLRKSINAKTKIEKIICPGSHGCVGGGEEEYLGLSNAAAVEVIKHLQGNSQMQFDPKVAENLENNSDPLVAPDDNFMSDKTWWDRVRSGGYRDRRLPLKAKPSQASLERFNHVTEYADQHASTQWRKYVETRDYIENRLG